MLCYDPWSKTRIETGAQSTRRSANRIHWEVTGPDLSTIQKEDWCISHWECPFCTCRLQKRVHFYRDWPSSMVYITLQCSYNLTKINHYAWFFWRRWFNWKFPYFSCSLASKRTTNASKRTTNTGIQDTIVVPPLYLRYSNLNFGYFGRCKSRGGLGTVGGNTVETFR